MKKCKILSSKSRLERSDGKVGTVRCRTEGPRVFSLKTGDGLWECRSGQNPIKRLMSRRSSDNYRVGTGLGE